MPAAQWARTRPIGKHGITAPTLWARLGCPRAVGIVARHETQWETAGGPVPLRLLQGLAVRGRSGGIPVDAVPVSGRARTTTSSARGATLIARRSARCGAKWLKIIFVMWQRQVPYDEQYHLATMTRQPLRQRQQQIA